MKQLNILVVDDEPSIRDFFSKLIQFLGHKAILAENGFDAIDWVKKEPQIDLVFLDYKMPGIDGLETFKQIRNLNVHLSVIMVTGYAPDDSLEKAKDAGMNGFVRKPMDLREIKDIIHETQNKEKALSVLVIDDDLEILEYFRQLSKEKSFHCDVAANSERALNYLKNKRYHIVFLDVVLAPGEMAFIQEEIKKLPPPFPDVILMSGFKEEMQKAKDKMALTISGCLSKPFRVNDIVSKIQSLAKKKEQDEQPTNQK